MKEPRVILQRESRFGASPASRSSPVDPESPRRIGRGVHFFVWACQKATARSSQLAARVRTPSPNPCRGSTVSGHEPRGGVEADTVGSCARDEDVAEFVKAGFNLVVAQLVREAADDAHRPREAERVVDRVPEVDWLVERREL